MTALVTGVAGFIGSRLAEELAASGADVVGIDRFSSFYDPQIKRRNLKRLTASDRFRLVEADLNEIELEPLVGEVDVVYHLAAQRGVRVSWGDGFDIYTRDNVVATQRLPP